jgi:hypothetical protein
MTHVSSQVVRVGFLTPSGDSTCNCGLVSLGRLWWPVHFILSGGGRMSTVPPTNSSLPGIVGATLVAASFCLRAVRGTNSSLPDIISAPLVTASFHLRAMHETNSSLPGIVGAPFVVAFFLFRAMCDTNC